MDPVKDAHLYVEVDEDGTLEVDDRWRDAMAAAGEDEKSFLTCVQDNIAEGETGSAIYWAGAREDYAEFRKEMAGK
jgi:hypothetical protein